MVERRVCTFCGVEIEPGTGRMYVKRDGVVFNFCSSKCYKNLVELGRVPRRTTWTRYYDREKQIRLKSAPEVAPSKKRKAKKVKKPSKETEESEEEAPEEPENEPEAEAGDETEADEESEKE